MFLSFKLSLFSRMKYRASRNISTITAKKQSDYAKKITALFFGNVISYPIRRDALFCCSGLHFPSAGLNSGWVQVSVLFSLIRILLYMMYLSNGLTIQ